MDQTVEVGFRPLEGGWRRAGKGRAAAASHRVDFSRLDHQLRRQVLQHRNLDPQGVQSHPCRRNTEKEEPSGAVFC